MPIEELLLQVSAEHEALKAKYDEAVLEIAFLRTKLTTENVADHHLTIQKSPTRHLRENLQEDAEAVAFQHIVVVEQVHGTDPGTLRHEASQGRRSDLNLDMTKHHSYLKFSSRARDTIEGASASSLWRNKAHRFLVHPVIEFCLVIVLTANCVIMWIETDANASSSKVSSWTESIDIFFLALYMAEFVLRVFAYGSHVFQDKWSRLDFVVIVMDVSSFLGKLLLSADLLGDLNMSVFRLFRLFRVARVFKVFRHVSELQLLIFGFYGAVRGVFFAVVMLEIVMLSFCFLLVETVHPVALELQCESCLTAYSSMWQAHLSMIQQIIAGDSWGQVNLLIIDAQPETALIFLASLVVIQFAMLNLIFTVIVDAAHRARLEDEHQTLAEKEYHFQKLRNKLIGICHTLDTNGNGELSIAELVDGYTTNPAFADTMASLDISKEDMQLLFKIMDEDRSGSVSSIEFVNNIYKLKEQDIHTTLMFVKGYLVDLRIKVQEDISTMLLNNIDIVTSTQNDIKHVKSDLKLMVPSSAAWNSEDDAGMITEARPLEERLLVEPRHELAKIPAAIGSHIFPEKAEKNNAAEDAACFHVSEDMIRLPPVRIPSSSESVNRGFDSKRV